ncbi:DUF433 domain-containing protein [Haloarcula laminariae]|uniref:DUF433 domain-containing protein n=1 Tax=Haloarcula laminariae TaxID=2961577 RepID=UPI0021C9A69C|nr:DUF433 domain-containing protein [Halomicroarcula laminariae]
MDQNRHLDLNGSEPMIYGMRISVLDVYYVDSELEPEEAEKTLFDDWDLNEEQVDAALEYYRNNEAEMKHIQARKTEIANS